MREITSSSPASFSLSYEIRGGDFQYVEITLPPSGFVISLTGNLMYKEPSVEIETTLGDKSERGFFSSVLGIGKRILVGAGLFLNAFINRGSRPSKVAFASPFSGRIIPLDLSKHNGRLICQKESFLCAGPNVAIDVFFQKRVMTALFGGEGFIMQKLEGTGTAFIYAGGSIAEKILSPSEELQVDPGCVVAFEPSVSFELRMVGGIKTQLFGGKGFFLACLKGPGRIWLQSQPFSKFVAQVVAVSGQGASPRG